MDITLCDASDPEPNTTGFKLRQRREELALSARNLAKLSGVSRAQILKAERCEMYLNRNQYIKLCVTLQIDPESIIDNEYNFFYGGYGQVIEFLVNKMGTQALLDSLHVHSATLLNWMSGRWMPQFKQRRALIKLYNELL